MSEANTRKIMHVDMDAFYASRQNRPVRLVFVLLLVNAIFADGIALALTGN
jgi:nucleotidyltransferase/DNA polymerase involved in DNA repair